MNRKKKFLLNSSSGLIKQFITLICGFVMTRAILAYFGSSVNGLVSSISQFLGFIGFLEMGVGPVIQSNLYRPLAENNKESISKVVKASEKFFRRIAYIFVCYIFALCVVLPIIIDSDFTSIYTVSLVLILSISTFAQYYFGMTYQLLLNADQKGYVQITIQWVTLLTNTILCVILMRLGASIHIVKLVTAIIYVFRPLFLCSYVKKNYCIDKNITYKDDPLKQKWNGFAQHFSAVIVESTDVVILTLLSTLENVSVYTVYYSVVHGITQVIMTMVNGLEAMWGNMIANDEWDTLRESFSFIEWSLHTIVTIIFTIMALLITPFVAVYTKGITDAQSYYQPLFGGLLVAAFALQCYRIPYFRIIKAAGHYKETQNGAFIAMVLNITISIIFVNKFGLVGVAIGTLVALGFHTCYFVVYLAHSMMKRSVAYFVKHMVADAGTALCGYLFSNQCISVVDGYLEWVIMGFKVSAIVCAVSFIANIMLYHKEIKKVFGFIRRKLL